MVPTPLVGRHVELAAVRRLLDPVAGGGLVVLLGEAGMGKSSVVAELVPDARGVARVPSPPAQQGPVWRTWTVDLRRAGGQVDGDGTSAATSPEERADALVALWQSVAMPRRPLLVVEDAHWADEETLRLLERLAGPGVAGGLRLLVTVRPHGEATPRLLSAARSHGGAVVELGAWDDDEASDYARQVLGVTALDPQLAQRVRGAAGWPLLVAELVEAWRRDPASVRPGTGRLQELVAAQLGALPASTYDVLVRAALLGTDPDTEVLAASYDDPAGVAPALRAGRAAGLLVDDRTSGRVSFRHDLVREAVLADVVDLERRAHATALLAPLTPAASWTWRWRQVAELAVVAGRVDLAVEVLLDGASVALASGSPLLSSELADRVASLARGPAQVRGLALAVRAHALAGDVARALAAGERFDAAEAVDPDPTLVSAVQEARARCLGARGRWQEALGLLDASGSSIRALALLESGDADAARDTAEEVLAGTGDPAARCEAMEVAGRVARTTDLDAAHRWFALAAAQAESARLPLWRARALHEVATIAQIRGLDVAPLHAAREAAVAAGAVGLVTSVDFHIAAVHGVRFEPGPALVAARRLLVDAHRLGLVTQEAWAWILIGQAHAVAGNRPAAEQAVGDAAALAGDQIEVRAMTSGIRALAALVDADLDGALPRWNDAVQLLRRSPAPSPLPPWYLWPLLASVRDLEGDGGARARAEVADSELTTFPGVDGLCRVADAVAWGRAGDSGRATATWRDGSARVAEVPAFLGWLHLAHLVAASAAHADGWGEPGTWLAEAEDWFADRRLPRLAAACRATGHSIGVPQRRRGRGIAEVPEHLRRLGVTSREMDVLLLVAEGRTNAEVAACLVLAPGTVKGYVERLLAKTGAVNRTGLAAHLTGR